MKFIDDIISEKSIIVIENIKRLHVENRDDELIDVIMKNIPEMVIQKVMDNFNDSVGFNNRGMIFNNTIGRNIKVERNIRDILGDLEKLLVSSKVMNKRMLQEFIIYHWVYLEEKKFYNFIDEKYDFRYISHYDGHYSVNIEDNIWNSFKYICERRNISNEQGFKLSTIAFLEK